MKTKFRDRHFEKMSVLFEELEKVRKDMEPSRYARYFDSIGLNEYIVKIAEQKQRNSEKMMKNIQDLINIAGKYDSIGEFCD